MDRACQARMGSKTVERFFVLRYGAADTADDGNGCRRRRRDCRKRRLYVGHCSAGSRGSVFRCGRKYDNDEQRIVVCGA